MVRSFNSFMFEDMKMNYLEMNKRTLLILLLVFTFLLVGFGNSLAAGLSKTVEVAIVQVEKVQYKLNGVWRDVPSGGFTDICKDSIITFKAILSPADAPSSTGCPKWGGDVSGDGEEKKATFSSSGARSVTVECGNTITIPVAVDMANTTVTITWPAAGYTVDNNNGDATTVESPFTVTYTACADIDNNKWLLRVKEITGGVDIAVHLGGFKTPDPGVNITTEAQATAAINDMLIESSPIGPATTWVTEAAIKAHEEWHYDEWKCSGNHYWPDTETAMEKLDIPYSDHVANEGSAITALKTGAQGADAKNAAFKTKARGYWFTLGDSPGDRPYRAGGAVLNQSIIAVRNYAQGKGWTVPNGLNAGPGNAPCYQPWLPYNP